MDLKITKSTYEDAKEVNKLLTKLIVDEKNMMKTLMKIVLLNHFMRIFIITMMFAF